MLNIGPQELLLILVVALLVVGPRRLPELGRSIGKGLRELRKAQEEVRRTLQVSLDEPPRATTSSSPERTPAATLSEPSATPSDPSTTAGTTPDDGPEAGNAPAPAGEGDDVRATTEAARTLGRSLAELRRAREEIQRTFRVDVDDDALGSPSDPPAE